MYCLNHRVSPPYVGFMFSLLGVGLIRGKDLELPSVSTWMNPYSWVCVVCKYRIVTKWTKCFGVKSCCWSTILSVMCFFLFFFVSLIHQCSLLPGTSWHRYFLVARLDVFASHRSKRNVNSFFFPKKHPLFFEGFFLVALPCCSCYIVRLILVYNIVVAVTSEYFSCVPHRCIVRHHLCYNATSSCCVQ